ncbi:hypothetical protein I4U23_020081 [Adineta vaga]|nr:hypothetical protein I4U23_020081 [Adineta vaga]
MNSKANISSIKMQRRVSSSYTRSNTYQWLPAGFSVSPTVLTDLIDVKPNRLKMDPYNWYDQSDENDLEVDSDDDDPMESLSLNIPNIILTPDNRTNDGGVWHVEGMENEHYLQFRTAICEPYYGQDDHRGLRRVYGLADESPLNQLLGSVITQENRCIAFPNIYQHRVAPFQLKDPTQLGVRKILVFFLVDPSLRAISTAHVPPQQFQWYHNIIRNITPFDQLTSIVIDRILNYVDYPMTL